MLPHGFSAGPRGGLCDVLSPTDECQTIMTQGSLDEVRLLHPRGVIRVVWRDVRLWTSCDNSCDESNGKTAAAYPVGILRCFILSKNPPLEYHAGSYDHFATSKSDKTRLYTAHSQGIVMTAMMLLRLNWDERASMEMISLGT